MAVTVPKFMFPRFYIKAVAGSFTLQNRLTHTYMGTFETEKEITAEIKRYNEMTDYEFWEEMLTTRQVRIPKSHSNMKDTEKDSMEDWFLSAWSMYTDDFYRRNPKLLVEVEEIPYELVNDIKRRISIEETARMKAEDLEKREAERIYQEEQKEMQKRLARPEKVEVPEGKIGSAVGMEKLQRKKKKLKKKKVMSGERAIVFVDSDDLFS